MPGYGYMIVIHEGASDLFNYGIPEDDELVGVVYTSYADARAAIQKYTTSCQAFVAALYGEAFPFENTTFEEVMQKNGYASIGWIRVMDDEDEVEHKVPIGLLRVRIA